MNSLYFAPHQLLPANTGARLRDYQLARQLAARASVTFVEMRRADEGHGASPEHSEFASVVSLNKDRRYTLAKIARGLAGPVPVTVLNCWTPQLASQLAAVLRSKQFDTVQLEGVHLVEYLPVIQEAQGSPAIVADWHNIESELMSRYAVTSRGWAKKIAAKRTAKLLERAEDRLLETCAVHTVTSERERQKLLARCPSANIRVVPNGVDAGYYSERELAEACSQATGHSSRTTILFVGLMDYHANIDAVTWFSRRVWPRIARNYPDMHFTIVGRDPVPEVRALASDRITVTGTVNDVRPYYASAVAAVVPLRSGSGTRLKILEAMAAGVPVVSTRLGAEGIEAEKNIHLLLADTEHEFTEAISSIVASPQTRNQLSHAGRTLACKLYDWSVIGRQLCRIHEDLVETRMFGSLREAS